MRESLKFLLCLYTTVISVFEFGFQEKPHWIVHLLDSSTFVVFLICYFIEIAGLSPVARILDCISLFPYFLFSTNVARYFLLTRLWRLRQAYDYFCRLENAQIPFFYYLFRLAKLMWITLFTLHFEACVLNFLATKCSKGEKTFFTLLGKDFTEQKLHYRHMTSLYWAITTFTSVGYGDIHPVNDTEKLFVSVVMLLNIGLMAYLTGGNISAWILKTSSQKKDRDIVQAAKDFARRNHVPEDTRNELLEQIECRINNNSDCLQRNIIGSLSQSLRSRILTRIFFQELATKHLFRDVSHLLLERLASNVKSEYFPPNATVISEGEAPTHFYILAEGALEVVYGFKHLGLVAINRYGVVGEMAVLCNIPQPFTLRTSRLSKLLRVNRTDLFDIVGPSIIDARRMMNNLIQCVQNSDIGEVREYVGKIRQVCNERGICVDFGVPYGNDD